MTDTKLITKAQASKLWKNAIKLNDTIYVNVQTTIETAHQLGTILCSIKEGSDHGTFGKQLEDSGIDPRQAQRYMKLSKVPLAEALSAGSITKAIAPPPKNEPDPEADSQDEKETEEKAKKVKGNFVAVDAEDLKKVVTLLETSRDFRAEDQVFIVEFCKKYK